MVGVRSRTVSPTRSTPADQATQATVRGFTSPPFLGGPGVSPGHRPARRRPRLGPSRLLGQQPFSVPRGPGFCRPPEDPPRRFRDRYEQWTTQASRRRIGGERPATRRHQPTRNHTKRQGQRPFAASPLVMRWRCLCSHSSDQRPGDRSRSSIELPRPTSLSLGDTCAAAAGKWGRQGGVIAWAADALCFACPA
jgi:hypothetical protein